MLCLAEPVAPAEPADDKADDEHEDVTSMAAFNVKADRLEDFGLRVVTRFDREHSSIFWPVGMPVVSGIMPNTAASKAGLKPGERILKSDGRSTTMSIFSMNKWRKLQANKWAEVRNGKKNVTWTLEVASADGKEPRTVKLVVPTPPPHWGSTLWQKPEGRAPAEVKEAGPLAARARELIENGIWVMFSGRTTRIFNLPPEEAKRPLVGHTWVITGREIGMHRLLVTQQRGRTDLVFEVSTKEGGLRSYLTSPSGALEKSLLSPLKRKPEDVPPEETRADFEKEIDFWLNKVGRVTGRWPFEPILTKTGAETAVALGTGVPKPSAESTPKADVGLRAEQFLKLPPASEAQRAMFAEAMGKIGADADHWAYTETSHSLEDKRVTVMRVDPSKPDDSHYTLLKIDGKTPSEADVKKWREEGRDSSAAMGDLPPLGNIVDLTDVRVAKDEMTAVVFELPLRASNKEFPADKFQAVFRVNKTSRAFEDIAVKLRESIRVVGVVKITEAGLAARFQTLDPAYPPQPVWLRGGGAVRVLLVRFARDFESSRTDFRRVEPYEGPEPAAK